MSFNTFNERLNTFELEHKHITLVNEQINEEADDTVNDSNSKNQSNNNAQRTQKLTFPQSPKLEVQHSGSNYTSYDEDQQELESTHETEKRKPNPIPGLHRSQTQKILINRV